MRLSCLDEVEHRVWDGDTHATFNSPMELREWVFNPSEEPWQRRAGSWWRKRNDSHAAKTKSRISLTQPIEIRQRTKTFRDNGNGLINSPVAEK